MRIVQIRNNQLTEDVYCGITIQSNGVYEITSNDELNRFSSNLKVKTDLFNLNICIGNGDSWFEPIDGQQWLDGTNALEVIPTAPKNNFEMKPYGLCHAHIDSSNNHIFNITLSNKSGNVYTYDCSYVPEAFDCVCTNNTDTLDEIEDIDIQNETIELFEGRIQEGNHKLIKPYVIYFKFPTNNTLYQLWGAYCAIEDFGDDDHVCMQIVDVDNVLGYGEDFILKEYDEVWCKTISKSVDAFFTVDGSPGIIPGGLYGVVLYYPKDVTKTDVKIWLDYILTIES